MHFVFRADASHAIGSGHVVRCLTLAQALVERGATVAFVCREQNGHLCDVIEGRGHTVHRLPPLKDMNAQSTLTSEVEAMRAVWRDDALATGAAIGMATGPTDWLVVDHYALDANWERALRPAVGRILVVDDVPDRTHDCDLLLDQNLVADMRTRYRGHVPGRCRMLLGPEYALLHAQYEQLHDRIPPRRGPVRHILVYMGGGDTTNMTTRALEAVLTLRLPNLAIDVVLTRGNIHAEPTRRRYVDDPSIAFHTDLPSLAPLMAKADMAVGASGATSWERLCLGVPAVVVTLAENQRAIAQELDRRGLVRWVGNQEEVSEQAIRDVVAAVVADQHALRDWSERCRSVVDGRGVKRVCSVLLASEGTPTRVRIATSSDISRLSAWETSTGANDASLDAARSRVEAGLRDIDGCHLLVAENSEGEAIAGIRFDRRGDAWRTECVLAPEIHSTELEMSALTAGLLQLRAHVSGSLRLCGTSEGSEVDAGARLCIAVCSGAGSWIDPAIAQLVVTWHRAGHSVVWGHDAEQLGTGDICFYLSYERIVDAATLARFRNNLVVHASDLPKGRGWSPLTWQVLEGRDEIPVTLFEAADAVDSGRIYAQERVALDGSELIGELRAHVAAATSRLCGSFILGYPHVATTGVEQSGAPTYYKRRRPSDSRVDIDRPLREHFDLLRVVDPSRYPAWFDHRGHRYTLKIDKVDR